MTAGVAPSWLEQGVRVSGLSTHYGMLSYSMKGEQMHIDGGLRVPTGGIVVLSPIDGKRIVIHDLPADLSLRSQFRGKQQ